MHSIWFLFVHHSRLSDTHHSIWNHYSSLLMNPSDSFSQTWISISFMSKQEEKKTKKLEKKGKRKIKTNLWLIGIGDNTDERTAFILTQRLVAPPMTLDTFPRHWLAYQLWPCVTSLLWNNYMRLHKKKTLPNLFRPEIQFNIWKIERERDREEGKKKALAISKCLMWADNFHWMDHFENP